MSKKQTVPRPRIRTVPDAERCIRSIVEYLRTHESPLAAEDLVDAVAVLVERVSC